MLTRNEKEKVIEEIKGNIDKSRAVFLTNLVGLSSNDAVSVRKNLREAKGAVVVTKNTLFELAAKGTDCEKMLKSLKGTNAVAFAFEDAPAIAKCLKNSNDEFGDLVPLRAGILDGELLSDDQLKQLANLPSRNEMLGTLFATFNAPISALARVLNAVIEMRENGSTETVENKEE